METKVNYTLVGAFVIGLIAAITFAIIWLSSGFSLVQDTTYLAYMQESVSGLNIDSPVELNGVQVGSVKAIELTPDNPRGVELTLSIKKNAPITQSTVATLNTRGVTGITYIALKNVGNDLRPLTIQPGERYPVIATAPSLFMRLDTALQKLSANLQKVSEAVQSVLGPENRRSITEILINLEKVTNNLAANNNRLNTILINTSKASGQLAPLMQSSQQALRLLEGQTLPAAYNVLTNLDTVSKTLLDVSQQLKQNPSVLIRGSAQPTLGPGERR